MILARKIIKIYTRIFMIFARKMNKIPEFYTIFDRKMLELYIIIGRKIFSRILGGTCPPPSPTPINKWEPGASRVEAGQRWVRRRTHRRERFPDTCNRCGDGPGTSEQSARNHNHNNRSIQRIVVINVYKRF